MWQGDLWSEKQSKRAHGSCQARLATKPEALPVRAILRDEPEYSDGVRSVECPDIDKERSGRSGVRALDWKHILDQLQCRQFAPHRSKPPGNSEGDGPIRHLARTGRQCSLQS